MKTDVDATEISENTADPAKIIGTIGCYNRIKPKKRLHRLNATLRV